MLSSCTTTKRAIPTLVNCSHTISKELIVGNWEFEFQSPDNKKKSLKHTPFIIRYEYFDDNSYHFYYKRIYSEFEEFNYLPLNQWVEIERGTYSILNSNTLFHNNKSYTEFNRMNSGDHEFKVKQVCTDFLIAVPFSEPKNNMERKMLNYFRKT